MAEMLERQVDVILDSGCLLPPAKASSQLNFFGEIITEEEKTIMIVFILAYSPERS